MRSSSEGEMWSGPYDSTQNNQLRSQHYTRARQGWLAAVGIGPGGGISLSLEGQKAIEQADIIIGYKTYLDLIADLILEQTVYAFAMQQEVERCKKALDFATQGYGVVVVSSGDPGVYGMAGLLLELNQDRKLDIHVVPGIPSATGAAASLGAPLMHDFAVISLSDVLTSWEKIVKRIEAAAESDFVIVFNNPKSKQRREQINIAREKLLAYRDADTPVGIVTNNYRRGEKVVISTLENFLSEEINMATTVIVGNSQSYTKFNQIITPRGYR